LTNLIGFRSNFKGTWAKKGLLSQKTFLKKIIFGKCHKVMIWSRQAIDIKFITINNKKKQSYYMADLWLWYSKNIIILNRQTIAHISRHVYEKQWYLMK